MAQITIDQAMQIAFGHHQAGRLAAAEGIYRQVLARMPDHVDALHLLGAVVAQAGHPDEAIALIGRALELKPSLIDAYNHLGVALRAKGRHDEAIAAFGRALELRPDFADAHGNLGVALQESGRRDEAIAHYRRALELKPDRAATYSNLGVALREAGRLDEATVAFGRAIEVEPSFAEAHNNLGNVAKDQGRLDQALASYQRAVAVRPGYAAAASNFVFSLLFHPDRDARAILAEHRRWEVRFAAPLAGLMLPHTNLAAPERRLRIGYVSPNLCDHVVGRNLAPLFREHDHQQFEIFCYANVIRPDALTRRLQAHADQWRDIVGRTDQEVAELIRGDGIDILVDLALHMSRNRLLVLRKPAPVQATFAGYPGTTGLSAIDYRLTDPHLDPPGAGDADYAEASVRLSDSFWCYAPPGVEPAVNSAPALASGFVTFGCLNQFAKVNAPVLALWARVLRAVDRSRLVMLTYEGAHRADTLQRLEQAGVSPGRVSFVAPAPHLRYLELYHGIDLVLDTFPYNGHTTSLDALWMGVPVVTTAGRTAVGRAGLSQLTNLGLEALVAPSPDEFVRIAVDLTADLPRLAGLRATLRERMRGSALMDASRFARGIEAAYRTMWRRWCARRTP